MPIRRWNDQSITEFYKSKGCTLLDTLYKGVDEVYQFICSCGNVHRSSFKYFRESPNCPKCTYENKREEFKNYLRAINEGSDFTCKITTKSHRDSRAVFVDKSDFELVMQGHLWRIDEKGYASRKVRGSNKLEWMHKLIIGADENVIVDHIDGNPTNNCKINLRVATRSENNRNARTPITNTTGYKGVTKSVSSDKFVASIMVNYKRIYLGVFETSLEGAIAYNDAALIYHGKFAKLNDIEGGRKIDANTTKDRRFR